MLQTHCITPYNPLKRTKLASQANNPASPILWATAQAPQEEDLSIMASRVVPEHGQEVEPGALEFVKDAVYDKWPDNFPAWQMVDELFDHIIARPGSALAFRYLLVNAAQFRMETMHPKAMFPNPSPDILQIKLDGMIERIAAAVEEELAAYESGEAEGRGKRPADIYRRYGLALRYAVEELGSFRAKDVLNDLMCATTLPIDELENPAWIDPYTGEGDKEYDFIQVRGMDTDLSSDGNLPATLADLMENLGEEGSEIFEADLQKLGLTIGDYWKQFIEAQRSGYSPLPEIEDDREEPEFDVIEKDFSFKADLTVDYDAVAKIKERMGLELARIKELVNMTAEDVTSLRGIEAESKDLKVKVVKDYETQQAMISRLKALALRVEAAITATTKRAEALPKNALSVKLKNDLTYLPFRYPVRPNAGNIEAIKELLGNKITKLFKVTWGVARARFYSDPQVLRLVKQFSTWACEGTFEPKDLLTVLLPYQNAYGFQDAEGDTENEDIHDLDCIIIPEGWGRTLAGFLEVHGEEFYEQFITKGGPGIYASADPEPRELEEWTEDVVADRIRMYKSPHGARIWRRVYQMTEGSQQKKAKYADYAFAQIYAEERAARAVRIQKLGHKDNVINNPEFIDAEIMAAIMGDGGANIPQEAGWDAWRNAISPEANAAFKREFASLRNQGVPRDEARKKAMDAFKVALSRANSRIDSLLKNGKGLRLKSGRDIDWGITRLKLEKDEIPTTADELQRILKALEANKFAPWFQAYLRQHIKKLTA